MKKLFTAFAIGTLFLTAFNEAPEAEKVEAGEKKEVAVAEGDNYKIDAATSTVEWTGTKPTGYHNGTFAVSEGTFAIKDNNVASGNFTIDIAAMKSIDYANDTAMAAKLLGHLKSPDFFDVAKYPTAKFAVVSSEVVTGDSTATHRITGNLTLKDSTKSVTIPAKVSIENGTLTATANFNIDRSQWGLSYGNDASLKDKFIKPEVNLKLNLKASK